MKKRLLSAFALLALLFSLTPTAVPTNYDSTYQAVRTFASGKNGVYESYVSSLPVTGLEGQTVTAAVLSNPFYPVYAQ